MDWTTKALKVSSTFKDFVVLTSVLLSVKNRNVYAQNIIVGASPCPSFWAHNSGYVKRILSFLQETHATIMGIYL